MRIVRYVLTSALLLSGLLAPRALAAPAAKGSYQFTLGDQYLKYVEFDAQTLADGSTSGRMYFSDQADIVEQDVDGTGDRGVVYKGFYVTAALDQLTVTDNRAVMSGVVQDASIASLIGQRVLLTVEDNGDNTRVPDRLTWGVYNPLKRGWTPSDAELKEDPGVGLTWWATDAELKDDRGYQMPRDDSTVGTQTFPLDAYAYADARDGAGDIFVQP